MQAGRLARSLSLLHAPRALRRAASAPGTVLRPAPLPASAVRAGVRAGVRGGVSASAGGLHEAVRCGAPRQTRQRAWPHPSRKRRALLALRSRRFHTPGERWAAACMLHAPAAAGYSRCGSPGAAPARKVRRLWR
jgi:hypothetical protein